MNICSFAWKVKAWPHYNVLCLFSSTWHLKVVFRDAGKPRFSKTSRCDHIPCFFLPGIMTRWRFSSAYVAGRQGSEVPRVRNTARSNGYLL